VVDRLHVHRDDDGAPRVLRGGEDVGGRHRDGAALDELGRARVDDDDVGPVGVEHPGDLLAPHAVAGDVDDGLARRAQDEARGGRHRLADLPVPVARRRAGDLDPVEVARVPDGEEVRETVPRERLLVLRLAEDGEPGGKEVDRRLVEVVAVEVGDEHGVRALDRPGGGDGQGDEGVAPVVRGAAHGGPRLGRVEHRVDEEVAAGQLEDEGGMADQAEPHAETLPPRLTCSRGR
jgi:hypothetical protein